MDGNITQDPLMVEAEIEAMKDLAVTMVEEGKSGEAMHELVRVGGRREEGGYGCSPS